MPKKITKEIYFNVKKTYTHPLQRMHALYNMHCDTEFKIENIIKFESYLQVWFGIQGFSILNGCLMVEKKFDSQFAQK